MKNTVKDLESLSYQMSDEELDEIMDMILFKKIDGLDLKNLSNKKIIELTEFVDTIPFTQDTLNTLAGLGFYKKEDLEAENRRLYEERGWERYL